MRSWKKVLEKEKELSELKTRFVAMASHEFRTPLATINSSAELLERFQDKWDGTKKLKHLHRIQSNVAHMAKLLEDVLIFGLVESGRVTISKELIDLTLFITELVEDMQFGIASQHNVELLLPEECFQLEADKKIAQDGVIKSFIKRHKIL